MDLQIAKRARHLIGYATTITQIRFNPKTGCPEWHLRDPLTAYPATLLGVDDMRPRDVILRMNVLSDIYERCILKLALSKVIAAQATTNQSK